MSISLLFALNGCADDALNVQEPTTEHQGKIHSLIPVVNGRLFFNTEDELVSVHRQLADGIINNEYFVDNLSGNGFISLNTEYSDANFEAAYNYIRENNLDPNLSDMESLGDSFDFAEKVIPDDNVRLLLNINGELQVANTIYKYTDVGLLSVEEQNYPDLQAYLRDRQVSPVLLVPTPESVVLNYSESIQAIGRRYAITDNFVGKERAFTNGPITIFLPYDPDPSKSSNQAKAYESTHGNDPLKTDPNYEEWFNTLADCSPRNTAYEWVIGKLFGDHDLCIDKYESKRRVKTKAWNMDYGLFFSIGVEVKHQFRGWTGIWRGEHTTTVKALAEAVQFEYDIDMAQVYNNSTYGLFKTTTNYYSNIGWKHTVNPQTGYISSGTFSYNNLPYIFQSDVWTMESYGTGWSYLDNLIKDGVNNLGDANNLNEWFWQGAWSGAKGALSALGKFDLNASNRSVAYKFPESNRIIIQKSNFATHQNSKEVTKYFDYGGGIKLTLNAGSGDFNLNAGPMTGNLKPKKLKVKLIGAVLHNGVWHGQKLSTF